VKERKTGIKRVDDDQIITVRRLKSGRFKTSFDGGKLTFISSLGINSYFLLRFFYQA